MAFSFCRKPQLSTGRNALRDAFTKAREEAMAKIARKFDRDGDGTLNDAEKVAAFTADLAEERAQGQFTVRRYDEDGDGSLSDAEKLAAVEDLEERRNRFNRRGEVRRGPYAEDDRPRRSPEAEGDRPRGPRPNRGGGYA